MRQLQYEKIHTLYCTILKGFKQPKNEDIINRPSFWVRILAELGMVTSVISYTAILSELINAGPMI